MYGSKRRDAVPFFYNHFRPFTLKRRRSAFPSYHHAASSSPILVELPTPVTSKFEGMAQREEETEIQVSETLSLCVNNCGFYGNPATKNMCQSCFQAVQTKPTPTSCSTGSVIARSGQIPPADPSYKELDAAAEETASNKAAVSPSRVVCRCSGCRRKVGLTGFRCRCGELFCGEHRYSDRHDCSFDYKAAGRKSINRENPVVRASKIVKI